MSQFEEEEAAKASSKKNVVEENSLNAFQSERVRKEPMVEPSSEHERVEMSRALRDVMT
uniref:Uncharacterized protein n=1 Tax=Brassica oleracea var. oleracea TaxID=109376 RepID=A0A0D3D0J6_BRAOL